MSQPNKQHPKRLGIVELLFWVVVIILLQRMVHEKHLSTTQAGIIGFCFFASWFLFFPLIKKMRKREQADEERREEIKKSSRFRGR